MRRSINAFLLLVGGVFFLSSCGNNVPDHARVIPNDAQAVMTTNFAKVALKADVEQFKQSKAFQEMKSEMDREMNYMPPKVKEKFDAAMEDPTVMGINFLEDIYMFVKPQKDDDDPLYTGVSMRLSDAAKYEAFLKDLPEIGEIKQGDGYQYFKPDPMVVMAWNDEMSLWLITGTYDAREKTEDFVKELMAQKAEESFATNERFGDFMAQEKDFGVFYNWSLLKSAMPRYMRRNMDEQNEIIFKENYSMFTVNFESDKIAVQMENLFSKEFQAKFDVMKGNGVPADYNNFLTDNNKLIGFGSAAFNVESFFKIAENDDDLSEVLDEMSRELGVERDDLKTIFTGDMAYSFMDMEEMEITVDLGQYGLDVEGMEVEPYTQTIPVPKTMTIIGINDSKTLEGIFEKMGMNQKDGYWEQFSNYFVITDDKLMMTAHEGLAKKLGAGSDLGAFKNGYEDLMSDNPFAGYISLDLNDWPPMIRQLMEMSMSRGEREQMTTLMEKFDCIVISGNWVSASIEVKMNNSGQNSLQTMLQVVEESV